MSTLMFDKNTWAEYKALLLQKNPNWQHEERENDYFLWFEEGSVLYDCQAVKKTDPRNPDQIDWEDNFMPRSNFASGPRPYAFSLSDFDFAPKVANDVCVAGSAKSVFIPMCGTKYMNGGKLITDGNAAFGDWIECQVVDHDNLLGYGVDFVLKSWVDKWFLDWKACSDSITTPYVGLPPAGMHLRLTYHSVGAADVSFALNLLMHKAI